MSGRSNLKPLLQGEALKQRNAAVRASTGKGRWHGVPEGFCFIHNIDFFINLLLFFSPHKKPLFNGVFTLLSSIWQLK